ncbi:hypothetical protein H310_06304 [Aphanomyces invadans]|uniref:Uncharacterized protein n=1 Tax=Aphanomyces invadans TaxID=157072 RepID=A0A024U715_9STRA|nr:hypothetical protein H310_06304 [Aphanomyces invadans]ETW01687.1 hypothetical protein H310_06304 [Aphanomyces invadans]RHY30097.1 hypothetical protein DYB32_004627 [Aphanomyces invadans]|eukprot:XP_008869535.1 hypothetical protein H310_06304 [Aphanomyces invadans]
MNSPNTPSTKASRQSQWLSMTAALAPRYTFHPIETGGVVVRVPVARDPCYLTALVVLGGATGYAVYVLEAVVLDSSSAKVIPLVFGLVIASFVLTTAAWTVFGCEIYTFATTKTITYEWRTLCLRRSRTFQVDLMKPFQVVAPTSSSQITRPTVGFLYDGEMVRLGFALTRREATDFLQDIASFVPEAIQPFQISPRMIQSQITAMEEQLARRTSVLPTRPDGPIDVHVTEEVAAMDELQ